MQMRSFVGHDIQEFEIVGITATTHVGTGTVDLNAAIVLRSTGSGAILGPFELKGISNDRITELLRELMDQVATETRQAFGVQEVVAPDTLPAVGSVPPADLADAELPPCLLGDNDHGFY